MNAQVSTPSSIGPDPIPVERRITPLPFGHPTWGDVAVGTVLGGSYKLNRKLAQGGMGDIYLASHERLPGVFVVKVLSSELAYDHEAFVRFQREAVVMTAIRHPNVVQVVDFNSTPHGMPYLVMEYLEGQDLAQVLAGRRTLTPNEVSRIIRKVACGLDAAHRLGIVHRDLKPENIMIVPCPGQQDVVKVIDFGISKARRFGPVTNTATVIGTPDFMSPEQAQGKQEEVDARSDQFALAVITYLLLTGHTPWGVAPPVETLHRVVNNAPVPMGAHVLGSFSAVESVLFRAMEKRPTDRYPSTLAFSRALDRAFVMDGLMVEAPTPEPATSLTPAHSFSATPALDEELTVSSPVVPGAVRAAEQAGFQEGFQARLPQDLKEGFVELGGGHDRGVPADPALMGAFAIPNDSSRVTPVEGTPRRVAPARPRRRRARYLGEGVVLFIALACGTSIGFLDLPTVRAQTLRGLGAVRALVSAVQHSTAAGVSTLSNAWRNTNAASSPAVSETAD